ncbi:MAG TPA: hypothetical protein VNM37_10575, partial [Candidatus Dormibacteraeota bacterium]|nr:hypothetical protein [Candidatus Dormibacteraeota bacterium]
MADWFDAQIAPVNQQGQQAGMQQVATAPDGVPVFQSGGKYFTRNADGSYAEQFQGEKPAWLTQQAGGQGGGIQMPAGIDPHLAQLYQQAGVTPGGPGSGFTDWQYWQGQALQNAGGDWNYITGRLGADLSGKGPDAPAGSPQGGGTLANPVAQMGAYQAPAPYTGNTPYTPQTIQQPGAVTPQQVTPQATAAPGQIQAQAIQGPQALTASTLANPGGFQGVSKADLEADPGYQYRLEQAQQALENTAAAKGIARGSNTWHELMSQASDMAAQQYQQTYANKFGEYQANTANTLNYNNANNANNAQAYGLTNQYQQSAALANQANSFNTQAQNIGN